MRIAVRLFTATLLVGALTLAVSQTTGVKADAFTNVGCATGNYSCLYANGGGVPAPYNPYYPGYGYASGVDPFAAVGCADGDYNCFASKTGVNNAPAPYYPGYGYAYGADPFAAVGCPEGNYGCLYGQYRYSGGTGIVVVPPSVVPNYTAPSGPTFVTTPISS